MPSASSRGRRATTAAQRVDAEEISGRDVAAAIVALADLVEEADVRRVVAILEKKVANRGNASRSEPPSEHGDAA